MPARWAVLASGSGGNASLLEREGAGLLVDLGLGPRRLECRMREVDFGWDGVRAALLTHTHSDHWRRRSLKRLAELRLPLFCHADHVRLLQLQCADFEELQLAGLVRTYCPMREFSPLPGVRCRAMPLKHDGGPTFGFRFASETESERGGWSLGYAADLGSWDPALPRLLADVDVLAIEFNHDVEMQLASGRARWLIQRVLGEFGHLSNVQAAQLLAECAGVSRRRLRHVIQLHLSRDCNRPTLAAAAAREVLARLSLASELHTADQDLPGPAIALEAPKARQLEFKLAPLEGNQMAQISN
jgi:ribonuclease BN (tRNA processing enzyme)